MRKVTMDAVPIMPLMAAPVVAMRTGIFDHPGRTAVAARRWKVSLAR